MQDAEFHNDKGRAAGLLKPLMPLLATAYGLAVIYVTALPLDGDNPGVVGEMLTWLLSLAAIGLTLLLVHRVEPELFPAARQFSLRWPKVSIVGLLLLAPLLMVVKEYIVLGITSQMHPVALEPMSCTAAELREDLLSGVHAVLLAPVLEELCFRQLAISPFRRRGAQVAVCVLMAILFGILHVRNFPGAFISGLFYGLVFVWSRSIWCSVVLHAGSNLSATLLAVYSWLQLGDVQTTRLPVIFLPDAKFIVGSVALAAMGLVLVMRKKKE